MASNVVLIFGSVALSPKHETHNSTHVHEHVACRLFPLAGLLLRRWRHRVYGPLTIPQPPSPNAPPPAEVAPGIPFPTFITEAQVKP